MGQGPAGDIKALKCPQCGGNIFPSGDEHTICQFCGSSLVLIRPLRTSGNTPDQAGLPESIPSGNGNDTLVMRGMRLKVFTYHDHEGTGLPLFRMLIPAGWRFQGGCHWMLDNPSMPAAIAFQVANPHGAEAFEVLPNMIFTNRTGGMPLLPGSKLFGAEVRQPISIRNAFRNYVLPRYRSSFKDIRILHEENLPDLPRLVKSEAAISSFGRAEGGKIRISYTWNKWEFEEEIYGVVEVFKVPVTTMFSMMEVTTWFIGYLFSFRASAGKLVNTADLFGVMIRSFQLNPQWYAAFKSIVQKLAQMQIQRIHHIGQIGEIYAQTGREIREQNLSDWYTRQDTYDRLATDWSRTIRDVDAFYDPHRGETVELPSGYGHAWANNLGEYILTEDPNFNPNIGDNLHWEPMQSQ